MRILCQFLPPEFGHLERFISPIRCASLNSEPTRIHLQNERLRVIREAKRQWLHLFLSTYEIRLQEYDAQYRELLRQVEYLATDNRSRNGVTLVDDINRYMVYHTNQLRQGTLKKMSSWHGKLLRNRQRSSSAKTMIGVSPEPYLHIVSNPFTTVEWQYLMLGRADFPLSFENNLTGCNCLRSILYPAEPKCTSSSQAARDRDSK